MLPAGDKRDPLVLNTKCALKLEKQTVSIVYSTNNIFTVSHLPVAKDVNHSCNIFKNMVCTTVFLCLATSSTTCDLVNY